MRIDIDGPAPITISNAARMENVGGVTEDMFGAHIDNMNKQQSQ